MRLTFIKALSGKLRIKDEFTFIKGDITSSEKVNEIRVYNGKKFENKKGTCEPPVLNCGNVYIKGRGPVESFMDYSVDLISFTKGNESISFMYDGYDECENANDVILKIGYDKERDVEALKMQPLIPKVYRKSSSIECRIIQK